jgi:hypothetical protein
MSAKSFSFFQKGPERRVTMVSSCDCDSDRHLFCHVYITCTWCKASHATISYFQHGSKDDVRRVGADPCGRQLLPGSSTVTLDTSSVRAVILPRIKGLRGLGLVVHFPSGCVAKTNIPCPCDRDRDIVRIQRIEEGPRVRMSFMALGKRHISLSL